MNHPVPALPNRDREHLSLLAVFHWVWVGFTFLGLLFLGAHYAIMRSVMTNPELMEAAESGPEQPPFTPAEFFSWFQWFYFLMGALLVAGLVLNILSAIYLKTQRHRMFSQVVAGLNCMSIPLGTTLGVFTFIVLGRESVRQLYEQKNGPG